MIPYDSVSRATDKSMGYIRLRQSLIKRLSWVALGSLHLWLVLMLVLPTELGWGGLLASTLSLVGMVAAVMIFLCTYSFMANAPERWIDERELAQRNAAYFRSYQYVVLMILTGLLYVEATVVFSKESLASTQISCYLTVLFFSSLIMPACILAWRDEPVHE